jgi:hypothetical protein
MKDKLSQIYEDSINKWAANKGFGAIHLIPPLEPIVAIAGVLQRIYLKTPDAKTIIITDTFKQRNEIVYAITHSESEDNNLEFRKLIDNKTLRLFTKDYVTKWNYNSEEFRLVITFGINKWSFEVEKLFKISKFKLMVLTELVEDVHSRKVLYEHCPILTNYTENQLLSININSPVEESQYCVELAKDDLEAHDKYTQYITQSLNIFGNFDNMDKARNGDPNMNISATVFREQLANENGWNRNLDMKIPFNKQIDAMFNPDAILERSMQVYDFIRKKSVLLSDNKAKLEKILEICVANKGKRILIVSKRSEFATEIAEYLNQRIVNTGKVDIEGQIFDTDNTALRAHPACCAYHDKLDKVPAFNVYGQPVYVKATGERKMIGAQAQRTLYQRLFNEGYINILSANNAVDKGLTCVVDLVIITSPYCDGIRELKYRCAGIQFATLPNKVAIIFTKNTTEENLLKRRQLVDGYNIVNKCENEDVTIENNGIMLVD